MSLAELAAVLGSTGLPLAYRAWDVPPSLPYLVYYTTTSANFGADNAVYAESLNCIVELYSDKKLPSAEALIESAFRLSDLYYEKSESWIQDEHLCLVAYSINI